MGLASFAVPDSAVTASSTWSASYKPGDGRLHFQKTSSPLRYGAWSTLGGKYLKGSWWQVDFGSWTKVTIIATQGRQDKSQWVTKYRVSYSYDGLFFKYYMEADYPKVFSSRFKKIFCLPPIRPFPRPLRSIRFGDVSKANANFAWTT